MSNNAGMIPAGANQIANSKASAGIFINLALVIYLMGFLYQASMKVDQIQEFADKEPVVDQAYKVVMFLGAVFLLIGLSRTIGNQYDLTRFFILAIVFALNLFFDDVYQKVMVPEEEEEEEEEEDTPKKCKKFKNEDPCNKRDDCKWEGEECVDDDDE